MGTVGEGRRRLISEKDGRFSDSLRHAGLTVRSTELDQSVVLTSLLTLLDQEALMVEAAVSPVN